VSGAATARRTMGTHAAHGVLLAAFGGLLFFITRHVADVRGNMNEGGNEGMWIVAGFGFLLLAGTLMSELAAPLGLPHLTGYLVAGIASGPHVLGLVDGQTVHALSSINTLALCLIALAGGAELDLASIRRMARSLAYATLGQTSAMILATGAVFLAARPLIGFVHGLTPAALIGVALLWGALAVTRSPSATLGILSQTRATGPLASFTLAFVMASDVVVVVLVTTVLASVRPLIDPSASFSLGSFVTLAHDLFGSVALGTTLGLVIAAYLYLVNRQMLVVLLVLGFGASTVLEYLQFDSLLTFMVAGFIVRNLSSQGAKFVKYIEQTGTVVYVVFFAIAGADLDVPLLRDLWPVALILAAARGVATWATSRVTARIAGDPPVLGRWGWSGLVSQAGLTLGLSLVVAREFPSIGTPFRALAVATVAVNEIVGPVLFKLALDRTGEAAGANAGRASEAKALDDAGADGVE
jgi:Kef-type K+ transport system membrane component KefB